MDKDYLYLHKNHNIYCCDFLGEYVSFVKLLFYKTFLFDYFLTILNKSLACSFFYLSDLYTILFILAIPHFIIQQICKSCLFRYPSHFNCSNRTISLLCNNNFSNSFNFCVLIIIIITI